MFLFLSQIFLHLHAYFSDLGQFPVDGLKVSLLDFLFRIDKLDVDGLFELYPHVLDKWGESVEESDVGGVLRWNKIAEGEVKVHGLFEVFDVLSL
jgi:hypothetical protein